MSELRAMYQRIADLEVQAVRLLDELEQAKQQTKALRVALVRAEWFIQSNARKVYPTNEGTIYWKVETICARGDQLSQAFPDYAALQVALAAQEGGE